jgi:large repetitive protein
MRRPRENRGSVAVAGTLVLAVAAACSSASHAPAPGDGNALAFRSRDGVFVGGTGGYSARVEADGRIALTAGDDAAPLRIVTRDEEPARVALAAGKITIRRSRSTERIANTNEGLSQTWEVGSRPASPFAVRVHVEGMDYAGESTDGHHWIDPRTHLGFRYGRATWVDATGRRTAIATTRDGDDLVMSVPSDVIAASSFPAVLDPIVGPEIPFDAPIPSTRGPSSAPIVAPGPDAGFLPR